MGRNYVIAVAVMLGCAAAAIAQTAPAPSGSVPTPQAQMAAAGYLARNAVPNSLLLNPPPPAKGSAAEKRDQEAAKAALALRGTPRWDLATRDADLFTKASTATFSCTANLAISPEGTPRIDALLRRVARDFAFSTNPTKDKYMRARPFMVNGKPICTPDAEKALRGNGSYPSGHSAIGYGWGLVLAEILPDRAGELVARGRAFGDSRRVCNVHWLSDVEEGRVVATAVFARLQSEPAFQADVAAARAEAAGLAGKAVPSAEACAREAAALAP